MPVSLLVEALDGPPATAAAGDGTVMAASALGAPLAVERQAGTLAPVVDAAAGRGPKGAEEKRTATEDRGEATDQEISRGRVLFDHADPESPREVHSPEKKDHAYEDLFVIPGVNAPAPVETSWGQRLSRLLPWRQASTEPQAFPRRAIVAKKDFALQLEMLLPWNRMDEGKSRSLPNYGEARRWRGYIEALKNPVPVRDRVLVYRVTDTDSLIETDAGLANVSYFLVGERDRRAGLDDLLAAAMDIWSRLHGTTNSIEVHTIVDPMEQRHTLRNSPWISTTRSFAAAPSFRMQRPVRVEAILVDPRQLFPTNEWMGESESLTPFVIWPEDIAASLARRDFTAENVRSALRRKYGDAAEAVIARTPGLR